MFVKSITGDTCIPNNRISTKMSDEKPDISDEMEEILSEHDIDVEDIDGSNIDPTLFEELPNLHLSRRLEMYKESDIEAQQRPRGILSKTDRDYLLGLKDYKNKQSEANRRQDIRNRIKNSIQDFKIIWSMLEKRDRDQIFNSLDDEIVDDSIEAMISFAYLGLNQEMPRLERAIKRGISAGENVLSETGTKQIDVSIDISYYPDVEATKKKLERAPINSLTIEEIGVLAKSNELDPSHIKKINNPNSWISSGSSEAAYHGTPGNENMDQEDRNADNQNPE